MALIASYLLFALLVAVWLLLRDDLPLPTAGRELLISLVPNFAALVLAFIVAATILERRGLSPEQRLRSNIVRDVIAGAKNVPAVRGIHPVIQTTPYGEVFRSSDRLEMVGRWYNETLNRCTLEMRDFLDAGGQLVMVLADPHDRGAMEIAARQYSGRTQPTGADVDQVRHKVLDTLRILERLCRDRPHRLGTEVQIYLTSMPINAWGIRSSVNGGDDLLYFAAYDSVRDQTSNCPTVVFDLAQSRETKDYWTRELSGLKRNGLALDTWRREAAERFIRLGGLLGDDTWSVSLRWIELERALTRAGGRPASGSAHADPDDATRTWWLDDVRWVMEIDDEGGLLSCQVQDSEPA